MSREAIETLVEKWMEDTSFRSAVRQDAAAAIRATGLELTTEEWAAVQNIDWSLSDEELSARRSATNCGSADGC
jgi:predicted ribosomally synthesized peptide with nif11-like leader